ncbi:hypothetical protein [Anaeromyxobacter soli]|uniref:hypothetical protein n=1 Tax=Anaeromyxobacter soli TaxID=2922725 RepID=UPI001FAF4C95|nr:hypothetical protein [Anaeromyxobacter sp. SG29]
MKLPVKPGEKFALISLKCGTDLSAPLDLGAGYFALPEGSVDITDHWKDWLGSIRTGALRDADVILLATGPTAHPEVLDGDNQTLLRRVDALYYALFLTGPLWIGGQGNRLTGANVDGRVEVRSASNLNMVFHVRGLPNGLATEERLRRAAKLAEGLLALLATRGMRRMKLAVNTFLKAFQEGDVSETVHQFVRSVDGISRAWNKNQFKERCGTFVTPGDLGACRELYMIRSNAEHFHPPDAMLPPLPRAQARMRAFRRAAESELLARHCMERLIETPELWPEFADDKADSFWRYDDQERERRWGARLDLGAAMTEFDERLIPDEDD